jgi:hypothetical protein
MIITDMKNKFINWLCHAVTGIKRDEFSSITEKFEEVSNANYISTEDFDPSDYDFEPLRDYDFSEFITPDFLHDEEYVTRDYITDSVATEISDFWDTDERVIELKKTIDDLKLKVEALEKKKESKKKKKKKIS